MNLNKVIQKIHFAAALCVIFVGPFTLKVTCGSEFRLAVFRVDVTVPMGHRLMGILPVKAERVADPLEARGFVLLGDKAPLVWVAVDWCEIRNEAHDRWREALAEASGTKPERVIVTCLHQHDAPVADLGAQKLLDAVGMQKQLCDPAFHEECVQRVAKAVREALKSPRRITHFGVGQAIVHNVASNRRMVLDSGKVEFSRGSSLGGDKAMRDAPDGLIDPWLRTLSFWDGEQPLLENRLELTFNIQLRSVAVALAEESAHLPG